MLIPSRLGFLEPYCRNWRREVVGGVKGWEFVPVKVSDRTMAGTHRAIGKQDELAADSALLELGQDVLRVELEKAFLIGADLVDVDMVEASLDILLDGLD